VQVIRFGVAASRGWQIMRALVIQHHGTQGDRSVDLLVSGLCLLEFGSVRYQDMGLTDL
jgi:hypothetical protein